MQLQKINKQRYRRHLNVVIVAIICTLIVGSLIIAQSLIFMFPSQTGSHFIWNLFGVITTSVILLVFLLKYKQHDYLTEVAYVWDLKMALNKITRVAHKLEEPAKQGNPDALLALDFSYSGSRQLWQLDDNNITLDDLEKKQIALAVLVEKFHLKLDLNDYHSGILKAF